jgi:hypothetical protein
LADLSRLGRLGGTLAKSTMSICFFWKTEDPLADIHAIKQAMEKTPAAGAAILNSRAAISWAMQRQIARD